LICYNIANARDCSSVFVLDTHKRRCFEVSIIVKAGPNDSSDAVIKKFQKRVVLEKVIQEYRDMQFHKKDSEKRQERLAERRRKINRAKRLSQYQ
jgi:ribosomal protein S21